MVVCDVKLVGICPAGSVLFGPLVEMTILIGGKHYSRVHRG